MKSITTAVEHRLFETFDTSLINFIFRLQHSQISEHFFKNCLFLTTQKRAGNPTNLITLGKNRTKQGKIGVKQLCDTNYAGSRRSFNTYLVVVGKSIVGGCWQSVNFSSYRFHLPAFKMVLPALNK